MSLELRQEFSTRDSIGNIDLKMTVKGMEVEVMPQGKCMVIIEVGDTMPQNKGGIFW